MKTDDIERVLNSVHFPLTYAENRDMLFDKDGRIVFDLRRYNYYRKSRISGEFMAEALNAYIKIYEAGKAGKELRVAFQKGLMDFPIPGELDDIKFDSI